MRTIVLGAGIAGLTAAWEESARGHQVQVVDSFDRIGGNHVSRDIGPYTFDIGAFLFFPDFPLFALFPEAREQCVAMPTSSQRIAPDGRVRRYPFEVQEIRELPVHHRAAALFSFLAGRLRRGRPRDVDDLSARLLGRRLYRHLGLDNYLARFYGLPASRIDPLFAEKRMQQFVRAARSGNVARLACRMLMSRDAPSRPGPQNTGLVRPAAGFGALYAPVRAALEARGVVFRLGERVARLDRAGARFCVGSDRGDFVADRVVSTIPAAQLLRLLGHDPGGLASSRLASLFVSFRGDRGFTAPILYNFQSAGRWKRLTMHSDAYGLRDGRSYCSVEVPHGDSDDGGGDDAAADFADFRTHVQACGLFAGELRLEGSTVTDNAYPLYTLGVTARIQRARDIATAAGVILAGRQGLHDYLPTSKHVMRQVKAELDRTSDAGRNPAPLSDVKHPDRADA